MKVDEIKAIAKEHGISAGKMKKAELVRAIQTKEGNYPCFETESKNSCAQTECLWRADCN